MKICECCKTQVKETFETSGDELRCEKCLADLQYCECCCIYRHEDEFIYNQEICDSCCDIKADKMQDYD